MSAIAPLMLGAAALLQVATPKLGLPIDWEALTPLPYRAPPQITPQMAQYVASQMRLQRCPKVLPANGRRSVRVDVTVLLAPDATVRATVPRAMDCVIVEQFTAGLVTSFARNNLNPATDDASGWYRATVTYDWPA